MTLARNLVRALHATRDEPLPASVALAAQLHLLDAVGVGLAAAGSPVGAAYRGLALEVTRGGPATVFGQSSGASVADAALINGGLIHSLEFDDTHTGSIVVATRIIEGKVDLATFENLASAAVRNLAGRMRWEPLPDARFPERFEAEIVCTTRAGVDHTVRIDDVYGNRTRPPGNDPVMAKFRANAARSLAAEAVEAVARTAGQLTGAPDIGAFSTALRQVRVA